MIITKYWYIFIDWFKNRKRLIETCARLQRREKLLTYALERQRKITENSIKIQNITLDRYLALQNKFVGDSRHVNWIEDAETKD